MNQTGGAAVSAAPEAPVVTREGDDHVYTWQNGLRVRCAKVRDRSEGTSAEVEVLWFGEHLHYGSLNLLSGTTRKALARLLTDRMTDRRVVNWELVLEAVSTLTIRAHRAGVPAVDAFHRQVSPQAQDLLPGFLPAGKPSILFAKGGSGKSLLAAAVTLSVTTGASLLPGKRPSRTGPVVVLDYEDDVDEWTGRLQALARGMQCPDPPRGSVLHQHMAAPLHHDADALAARCTREGVALVIVDSIAPAAGGELIDPNAAAQYFAALRRTHTTTLSIGHVNKVDARDTEGGAKSVYGGVWWENWARSAWELRRTDDADFSVALYQRKTNRGRRPPFGIRWEFTGNADLPETIRLFGADVGADPTLAKGLSQGEQVLALLRLARRPVPLGEIMERLGATIGNAREVVSRLVRAGKAIWLDSQPTPLGERRVALYGGSGQ